MNNHDLKVGDKFARWTVIKIIGRVGQYHKIECRCDCGNIGEVFRHSLLNGRSKSCGCFQKEVVSCSSSTHGLSETRTYRIWKGMRMRCAKGEFGYQKNYGARGIKVCERWDKSFLSFLEDMGEAPDNKSIDRIDVNGNYCKENCKWSTRLEQQRNRRDCNYVEFEGKRMCISELSEIAGVSPNALRYRIQKWGIKKAMNTPLNESYVRH